MIDLSREFTASIADGSLFSMHPEDAEDMLDAMDYPGNEMAYGTARAFYYGEAARSDSLATDVASASAVAAEDARKTVFMRDFGIGQDELAAASAESASGNSLPYEALTRRYYMR